MNVVDDAVASRVAPVTLNRAERGNGINRELIVELERCVERAELDPEVRVLLLAGHGKGFCEATTWRRTRRGSARSAPAALRRRHPDRRWIPA